MWEKRERSKGDTWWWNEEVKEADFKEERCKQGHNTENNKMYKSMKNKAKKAVSKAMKEKAEEALTE